MKRHEHSWVFYSEAGGFRCSADLDESCPATLALDVAAGMLIDFPRLRTALEKIDDIRNRVIGYQHMHWSRDIYPLVAALNEAGFEGRDYDECRAHAEREMAKAEENGVYRPLPWAPRSSEAS